MRSVPTLSFFAALLSFASPARAAFTVDVNQVGANVVLVGSGSLNITALTLLFDDIRTGIDPSGPSLSLGSPGFIPSSFVLVTIAGPSNFGTGPIAYSTIGSGDRVGLDVNGVRALILPRSYVSGSSLSTSTTFANTTYANLGLATGPYTYIYSARGSTTILDTFTIRVNSAAVPEPASLALVGLGLAGLGFVARRRSC